MKLRLLPLLFAVGALVSACDDDDGNGPESTGRVRVVHLSPDAPNVDVLVDGAAVATNVPYLTASEYLEVEAGTRNIAIEASGTPVIDDDVTVNDGEDYTVLVGGDLAAITLDALPDDNSAPAAGNARVRLIHGAPSAGLVDIYVTAPDDDLALSSPLLTDVDFGAVSDYVDVPAGDYRVRITPAGSETVVIDSGTLTLSSGQVRTGIAVDAAGGGAPYGAIVLEDLN